MCCGLVGSPDTTHEDACNVCPRKSTGEARKNAELGISVLPGRFCVIDLTSLILSLSTGEWNKMLTSPGGIMDPK